GFLATVSFLSRYPSFVNLVAVTFSPRLVTFSPRLNWSNRSGSMGIGEQNHRGSVIGLGELVGLRSTEPPCGGRAKRIGRQRGPVGPSRVHGIEAIRHSQDPG